MKHCSEGDAPQDVFCRLRKAHTFYKAYEIFELIAQQSYHLPAPVKYDRVYEGLVKFRAYLHF